MNTTEYLEKVNRTPEKLEFSELMELIENEYDFIPTAFKNGELNNAADQNMGSCKLFSFARLHGLNAAPTLACFGSYYRNDVLENPDGDDHQNIRNFMKTAWGGIEFSGVALKAK